MRVPSEIGRAPAAVARSTSAEENPPSGPTMTSTLALAASASNTSRKGRTSANSHGR
jgi:hypothetical protein